MNAMEQINRRTWRARSSLRLYGRLDGYTDPGEAAAFSVIANDVEKGRVLDIGFGGGRTCALLAPRARAYIGIDYTPEMVELARSRYPQVDLVEGDARDMSRFPDGSFDVVVFSCNGIDSVDAEGRRAILRECSRVLSPSGVLLYSTFNRDGPGFRRRSNNRRVRVSANPARLGYEIAKYAVGGIVGWRRILAHRRHERVADDRSILLHKAHDFGILVHAISLSAVPQEAKAAGFHGAVRLIGMSGATVSPAAAGNEEYVHVLARKT